MQEITLTISYSRKLEIERVQNTVKKIPWYAAQGYSATFAKLPQGITEHSSNDEITQAVEREYAPADYAASAKELQKGWKRVAKSFGEMRREPCFHFVDEYEVVLTKYGSGGSYNAETNQVIVNFVAKVTEGVVGITIHEVVHMTIQYLIDRYRVRHWRKERLVDLLVGHYFPELNMTQKVREDAVMVDEKFKELFPDIEVITKAVGD